MKIFVGFANSRRCSPQTLSVLKTMRSRTLLFITLTLNCCAVSAFAEPLEEGLVFNQAVRTCAYFSRGDECQIYSPPKGWQAIFPAWNEKLKKAVLAFDGKVCDLSISNWKGCCEIFGLKFVTGLLFASEPGPASSDAGICGGSADR